MSGSDYKYKVVIIGDVNVGKSSLIHRFKANTFSELGYDTESEPIKITRNCDDKVVELMIWDTAGEEKYRSITSSYYRGAHGIIFAFDLSNNSTFENVPNWIQEAKFYSARPVVHVLVGNKSDLIENYERQTHQDFANENNMSYVVTSAKTGDGVEEIFEKLVPAVIAQFPSPQVKINGVNIGATSKANPQPQTGSGGCC